MSLNPEEESIILSLESATQKNSFSLQQKEDNKLKNLINLLIDLQLNKLESKLSYLEEFEKLIWYEKTELEVLQRMNIAEKVNLAFKKNELLKQMHQHSHNVNSNAENLSEKINEKNEINESQVENKVEEEEEKREENEEKIENMEEDIVDSEFKMEEEK